MTPLEALQRSIRIHCSGLARGGEGGLLAQSRNLSWCSGSLERSIHSRGSLHSFHPIGVKTVAVYSSADANAQHVKMADESVLLGPPAATEVCTLFERRKKKEWSRSFHDDDELRRPLQGGPVCLE